MNKIRKFFLLSFEEQILLASAFFLLLAARFALAIVPFRTLRKMLSGMSADASQFSSTPCPLSIEENGRVRGRASDDEAASKRISWAVQLASRFIPGSEKCLAEALTAQFMLKRNGFPALLKIGVAKSQNGKFHAHAWVESDGKTVVGGKNIVRYTPLLVLSNQEPVYR